jgi:hypothetical protein
MLRVSWNSRSQRDSQRGEITPRANISRTWCCFTAPMVDQGEWGQLAAWQSKLSKAN